VLLTCSAVKHFTICNKNGTVPKHVDVLTSQESVTKLGINTVVMQLTAITVKCTLQNKNLADFFVYVPLQICY